MATLIVVEGPMAGQRFLLGENRLTMIGRHATCTIQVTDPQLSRFHLQLKRIEGPDGHEAIDFNSRNGVYVNGEKISQPTRLQHQDTIGIGETLLIYSNDDNLSALDVRHLAKRPGLNIDETRPEAFLGFGRPPQT